MTLQKAYGTSERAYYLQKGGKKVKKYETLELEVIRFETEDVITASGDGSQGETPEDEL